MSHLHRRKLSLAERQAWRLRLLLVTIYEKAREVYEDDVAVFGPYEGGDIPWMEYYHDASLLADFVRSLGDPALNAVLEEGCDEAAIERWGEELDQLIRSTDWLKS